MTTLTNRPHTALLVVDVQVNVVAAAHERVAVVSTIHDLVARARAERVAVLWVQHAGDDLHEGSDGWRIVPELAPLDGEPLVAKRHGDAFEATTLEAELARLGVGRLVVTGAQTDACIRATIHGAFTRGYDTVLVSDAHTTEDLSRYGLPAPAAIIAHTNMYWRGQSGPGRSASVVKAAEVAFAGT
jgi:nicotinamidase-related amidase